jgi:hypothetical protein
LSYDSKNKKTGVQQGRGRQQELLIARIHRAQLVDFSFGVALVRRRCRRNRPSADQRCSIVVLVHTLS